MVLADDWRCRCRGRRRRRRRGALLGRGRDNRIARLLLIGVEEIAEITEFASECRISPRENARGWEALAQKWTSKEVPAPECIPPESTGMYAVAGTIPNGVESATRTVPSADVESSSWARASDRGGASALRI